MTPKTADLIFRKSNHSLIRIDDTLGFNNYIVVNEDTKDYYQVSIAKNTTITETVNNEVFYTIKKNREVINEDIYTVLPTPIINGMIKEVEEYVDVSHREEMVDYFSDLLYNIGYTPRHVIHYDNVEETLDLEFLIIINGDLDSLYLSISKDGDVSIIEDAINAEHIGNIDSPDIIKTAIENHLTDTEHFTAMVSEEEVNEAIKESFNQNYGLVFENGLTKVYEKNTLKECGYFDRKNKVYKIKEGVEFYGADFLREISEENEVNILLNESSVEDSQGYRALKTVFFDKDIDVNIPEYKGTIRMSNPEYEMMEWMGRDNPVIKIDVVLSNVESIMLLSDVSVNVEDNPGTLELIKKLADVENENLPSSNLTMSFPKLVWSLQSWIEKKMKYFGLKLSPKIRSLKF